METLEPVISNTNSVTRKARLAAKDILMLTDIRPISDQNPGDIQCLIVPTRSGTCPTATVRIPAHGTDFAANACTTIAKWANFPPAISQKKRKGVTTAAWRGTCRIRMNKYYFALAFPLSFAADLALHWPSSLLKAKRMAITSTA